MNLSLLLLASLARAGEVLAVSYFDAHSVRPELEPLGRGVADMLTTDLAGAPGLRLVERQRLAEVLAELQLGRGGFLDASTAQVLGRGLGATGVVVGSLTVAVEGMRLDARVIDVATGEVRASAQATGREDELFRLEAEVARELLAGLGLPPTVTERPIPLDQLVAGSTRIDSADAALVSRLRALRDYKDHRLVRVMETEGRWSVAEGGLTRLTARQFVERADPVDGAGRLAKQLRSAHNAGWVMIGSSLVLAGSAIALATAGADPELTSTEESLLLTFTTACSTGSAIAGGIGIGLAASPKVADEVGLPIYYSPAEVDRLVRDYNARLAAQYGVSPADALALELK